MVVFWCPQVERQISNPNSLFSSETGVNPWMRSGKSSYLNDLDVNKPFVEVIFTKK
jgi:hypothetical protein